METINIIIPAYNASEFIIDALDSVYCQNINENNFKVIVVDDGSTDSTYTIVDKYRMNHNNLLLVKQINGGVSSARNKALKFVDEGFVTFLDADDKLVDGSLQKFLNATPSLYSDFVVLRSKNLTKNEERYSWKEKFEDNHSYSFYEIFKIKYSRGSVCGCMFRADFLKKHQITFPEKVAYAEDSIFFSLCLIHASSVTFLNIDLYNVITRSNSALTTYTKNKIDKFEQSDSFVREYLYSNKLNSYQIAHLNSLRYRIISRCIHDASRIKGIKLRQIIEIKWIRETLPIVTRNCNEQRLKMLLLNCAYPLFCLISFTKNRL